MACNFLNRRVLMCMVLLTASLAARAQEPTKIEFNNVLLTQEGGGWRVEMLDHASNRYALAPGDLIAGVDGIAASALGPLAMTAFMDNAFVRAFPISVVRGGRRKRLILYRSDGKVPPLKKLTKGSTVFRGGEAPEFSLPDLQGNMVALKNYRGKWVLLNFWATWCLPCQEESPILSKLAQTYPQQLQVLAVAVQDEHKKLETFSARTKPAYTVLESGNLKSTIATSYGVNNGMGSATVPFSVLIRPDGTVAYVQGGYEAPSPLESQVSAFIATKWDQQ